MAPGLGRVSRHLAPRALQKPGEAISRLDWLGKEVRGLALPLGCDHSPSSPGQKIWVYLAPAPAQPQKGPQPLGLRDDMLLCLKLLNGWHGAGERRRR